MFVVVWEPKRGTGGGHQLVMDKQKAERISRVMYRALPDAEIRVMTAAEHAAAAVTEQQQRRGSGRCSAPAGWVRTHCSSSSRTSGMPVSGPKRSMRVWRRYWPLLAHFAQTIRMI